MDYGDTDEIVEDEEDDDENANIHDLQYTNGNNEVVKFFNQKCVKCFERDSDHIFKQCGHQCICDESYQKKVILI